MSKLFIPKLYTKLVLIKDWNFTLHWEGRNHTAWSKMGLPDPYGKAAVRGPMKHSATIPAGAILTLHRIYIKQGGEAYDSLTFHCKHDGASFRFWAKLPDVNNIEYEIFEDDKDLKP